MPIPEGFTLDDKKDAAVIQVPEGFTIDSEGGMSGKPAPAVDRPMQRSHKTIEEQTPAERIAVTGSTGEKVKQFAKDAFAPVPAQVVAGWKKGVGGMDRWLGENVVQPVSDVMGDEDGSNWLTRAGTSLYDEGKAIEEGANLTYPVDPRSAAGYTRAAMTSIGQQLPLMAGGMAVAPAAGVANAARLPLAGMGMQTAAQSYGDYRDAGVGRGGATLAAAAKGGIEYATEKFPTEQLFKAVSKPMLATLGKMAVGEIGGEQVAYLTQTMIDKGYLKTDPTTGQLSPNQTNAEVLDGIGKFFTSGEAPEGMVDTFWTTLIQTGVMGGAAKGINALANRAPQEAPAPSGPLSRAVSRSAAPAASIGSLVTERRGMAGPAQNVAPAAEQTPSAPVPVAETQPPVEVAQPVVEAAPVATPSVPTLPANSGIFPIQGVANGKDDEGNENAAGRSNADEGSPQGDAETGLQADGQGVNAEGVQTSVAPSPLRGLEPRQLSNLEKNANRTPAMEKRYQELKGRKEAQAPVEVTPEAAPPAVEPETDWRKTRQEAEANADAVAATVKPVTKGKTPPRSILMNIVNMQGEEVAKVSAPYDGTKEDALRVAKGLKFHAAEQYDASLQQSQVFGTDEQGAARYAMTQGEGDTELHEVAKQEAPAQIAPPSPKDNVPVATEQGKGEKEPWQMTRDEFLGIGTTGQSPYEKMIGAKDNRRWREQDRTAGGATHKWQVVKAALDEGKPVPSEVLKDYPELQPQSSPPQPAAPAQAEAPDPTATRRAILTRLSSPKRLKDRLVQSLAADHGREAVNALVKEGMVRFPGQGRAEITKQGEKWLSDNPPPPKVKAKRTPPKKTEKAALKEVEETFTQDGGEGLPTREEIRAALKETGLEEPAKKESGIRDSDLYSKVPDSVKAIFAKHAKDNAAVLSMSASGGWRIDTEDTRINIKEDGTGVESASTSDDNPFRLSHALVVAVSEKAEAIERTKVEEKEKAAAKRQKELDADIAAAKVETRQKLALEERLANIAGKFKKDVIKIATKGADGKATTQAVEASVRDNLAVHKPLAKGKDGKGYVVTHVPTGLVVTGSHFPFTNESNAKRAALRILELEPGLSTMMDANNLKKLPKFKELTELIIALNSGDYLASPSLSVKADTEVGAPAFALAGESSWLGESEKLSDEQKKQLAKDAVKFFGRTYNLREAGYILPDGVMLDFSGRHYAEDHPSLRNQRSVDHRELFGENGKEFTIEQHFPDIRNGSDAMAFFMSATGAVRVDFASGVVSSIGVPTQKQITAIGNALKGEALYISYINPKTGKVVDEAEIERVTPLAVKRFFEAAVEKPDTWNSFSLTDDSGDTLSPSAISRIESLISKALPEGKVTISVVDSITPPPGSEQAFAAHGVKFGKVAGMTQADLTTGEVKTIITLAMDGANEQTGVHEILHASEALGIITEKDLTILSRAYPDKDGISSSERRADAFADYVMGKGKPPVLSAKLIFDKVRKFLQRLANVLKGQGWRTAEDVFSDLMGGKLKRNAKGEGAEGVQFSTAENIHPTWAELLKNPTKYDIEEWERIIRRTDRNIDLDELASDGDQISYSDVREWIGWQKDMMDDMAFRREGPYVAQQLESHRNISPALMSQEGASEDMANDLIKGNSQKKPKNGDIQFSLATAMKNRDPQALHSALTLHPKVQGIAATIMNKGANVSRWQKSVGTMYHLAEKLAAEGKTQFRDVFNKGQEFLNDISALAVAAESLAPDIFPKLGTGKGIFHYLSKADSQAIAGPLFEGTLYGGADPIKGKVFSDAELKTIFKLTPKQIDLYRQARAATDRSLDDMARSLIAKNAKMVKLPYDRDMELKGMAQELSATIQERIDDMQAELDRYEEEHDRRIEGLSGKELKEAVREHDKFTRPQEKAIETHKSAIENIKEITRKTELLKKRGYFPLMRFGDMTVTVKDRNGKVEFFGMYESTYKAKQAEIALARQYPDATVTMAPMGKEKYKLFGGLNLEALQLFAEHLDAEEAAPYQEYLKVGMNNRSAMKRLIHRKGTEGYSEDAVRTLAQFIVSNARHASTQYNLNDMRRLASEIPEQEQGDVQDQAVKLYEYLSKPNEEAAKLRGYLFIHYLGGSLASGIVNMTQPIMMTAPYLSTKTDIKKVVKFMTAASKMAYTDPAKVQGALGIALRRAEADGITAPQEIHQLTAMASNKLLAANPVWNAALKGWGGFFAAAEVFNRRTTFISAFNIAKDNGKADSVAYHEAIDAVVATQGIYNKGNRANWSRGIVGATAMTFKQYSVMYLELYNRLPMKQRMIMLGTLMLMAGLQGMPFAEDAEDIFDTLGQWAGYNTNSKQWMERQAKEVPGGQFLLRGVSAVLPIDLQGRMGLHNLIPGTAMLKQSSIDKGRDVAEFFGPAGGLIKSLGDTLALAATGLYGRAAIAAMPRAAQNIAQGAEMMATGAGRDKYGRKTVEVNKAEAAVKMTGFNPETVAAESRVKGSNMQDMNLLRVRKNEIVNQWAYGIVNKDRGEIDKALAKLKEWNAKNPDWRITNALPAAQKKAQAMKATSKDRFIKSVPKEQRRRIVDELG